MSDCQHGECRDFDPTGGTCLVGRPTIDSAYCRHGVLVSFCEVCPRDATIARLEAERDDWENQCRQNAAGSDAVRRGLEAELATLKARAEGAVQLARDIMPYAEDSADYEILGGLNARLRALTGEGE